MIPRLKARLIGASLTAALALGLAQTAVAADTLEEVRARGHVVCGVSKGLVGFSQQNDDGSWSGLDVDLCRAVAAATLGDAGKVTFKPLTARERFQVLANREIDILSRNTTWTLLRDSTLGINFAGVNYFDGQGFLIRADLGVGSALELSGAGVCVEAGTTTELNLADYFSLNAMDYRPVTTSSADEALEGYVEGRCDVYTSDRSTLAAQRTKLDDPDQHIILPEVISKEPLGPAVAEGDDKWADIVRWSLYVMLAAEELGVNAGNADELAGSASSPAVLRLLGVEGDLGEGLGLTANWGLNIVKQVGNYAESFERNVGPDTALGLQRGINALWKDGGIMYPMPIR